MKRIFPALFGLSLLIATACTAESGKMDPGTFQEQISPEALVAEAEVKYAEYLASHGGDRRVATEKTAAYLRNLPGVKEITVRGSDSLLVILRDGNELLLMLGRNRL
ncbi:MAG: hypothetical protein JXC33_00200 [Deltaproteobacteria bacterium]|nr:hypothetical protein [Deltaproteobacteria bacterium]